MSWLWTWEWFPVNLCIGIVTVIVVLFGIWLAISFFKMIIDEIFG